MIIYTEYLYRLVQVVPWLLQVRQVKRKMSEAHFNTMNMIRILCIWASYTQVKVAWKGNRGFQMCSIVLGRPFLHGIMSFFGSDCNLGALLYPRHECNPRYMWTQHTFILISKLFGLHLQVCSGFARAFQGFEICLESPFGKCLEMTLGGTHWWQTCSHVFDAMHFLDWFCG